jgi:hypothetical protein
MFFHTSKLPELAYVQLTRFILRLSLKNTKLAQGLLLQIEKGRQPGARVASVTAIWHIQRR